MRTLLAVQTEFSGIWNAAMKVASWYVETFPFLTIFLKAVSFKILGLVFGYGIVERAVFSIFVTHLSEEWGDKNLPRAAKIVNLQEGSYKVLQIIFQYVADAYFSLFNILVCSTSLYIIGLWLSYIASLHEQEFLDHRVFSAALVLTTFSRAAKEVTLEAFFGDQVLATLRPATEQETKRARDAQQYTWKVVSVLAAIVAFTFSSGISSFNRLLLVSAIVMVAAFLCFLLGAKSYEGAEPPGSPLGDVVFVIYTAITKRNVEYPVTPEQLLGNSSGLVQISPHVSWLRWLDRAAIIMVRDEEQQPGDKTTRTVDSEQVKVVKFLLKMLPMCTPFLVFSLVAAAGDTLFLEEVSNINDGAPTILFIMLKDLTTFSVAHVLDRMLKYLHEKKKCNGNELQRLILVRIGIGMLCCMPCCVAAWLNALHWLRLVNKHDQQDINGLVGDSFKLLPQYLLLGAMEGFSMDGFRDFYDSQVPESMSKYGPPLGECIMGIGRFVSVLSIVVLGKWIKQSINSSRLDKYYILLACLSAANFVYYCLVAYWYGVERFAAEEEEDDDEVDLESSIDYVYIESQDIRAESQVILLSKMKSFPQGSSSQGTRSRINSMR